MAAGPKNKRRWFELHRSTWAVLFLLAAALLGVNLVEFERFVLVDDYYSDFGGELVRTGGVYLETTGRGLPACYRFDEGDGYRISWPGLGADLLTAAVLLLAAGFCQEYLLRRRDTPEDLRWSPRGLIRRVRGKEPWKYPVRAIRWVNSLTPRRLPIRLLTAILLLFMAARIAPWFRDLISLYDRGGNESEDRAVNSMVILGGALGLIFSAALLTAAAIVAEWCWRFLERRTDHPPGAVAWRSFRRYLAAIRLPTWVLLLLAAIGLIRLNLWTPLDRGYGWPNSFIDFHQGGAGFESRIDHTGWTSGWDTRSLYYMAQDMGVFLVSLASLAVLSEWFWRRRAPEPIPARLALLAGCILAMIAVWGLWPVAVVLTGAVPRFL